MSYSVVQAFEERVRQTPEQTAVWHPDGALTYDELNSKANRIARSIVRNCGEQQGRIAFILESGESSIIALLGILKANKAYVPLDPSYPPVRNRYIVDDSQPDLILTDNRHLNLARELSRISERMLQIDDAVTSDGFDLNLDISAEGMAYLLYTSGSTGDPKGVVHTHANLAYFSRTYAQALRISSADRLSLLPSCSFSASVNDIFSALLMGATLCPYNISGMGIDGIPAWLAQAEITVLHSVPTLFRNVAHSLPSPKSLKNLRLVVLGGEPVFNKDIELHRQYFPAGSTLVNHLGFTEIPSVAQYWINPRSKLSGDTVPLGAAVDGVELVLVHDEEEDTSDIYQLFIRSPYLSTGYWRKPELTEKAFQHDIDGKTKLFITGDRVRKNPDGTLAYAGRKGTQVKIRGYRVEPIEVEAVLGQLEYVREAVVVSNMDNDADRTLVAYVVPYAGSTVSIERLRSHLQKTLPVFMIPSGFMVLDELPRTATGKIDRQALPVPSRLRPEIDTPFTAPQTATEHQLSKIWSEVLELDSIGINDDFIELGGDSIRAMQIITRILDVFETQISMQSLLDAPTVAEMSKIIDAR